MPIVLVHGGAGNAPTSDDCKQQLISGVKEAALTGYKVLLNSGNSIDAVVSAVVSLEDNPYFNAGRGSVLNEYGENAMHALVMRGDTCAAGGVMCLKHVRNPVKAARIVMDHSPHCLLDGDASLQLAREFKLPEEEKDYFLTERSLRRFRDVKERHEQWNIVTDKPNEHDTVGAVALDCRGNLACATSTGGITGQKVGRVSDSPLSGCGGFADNGSGMTPQKATENSLKFMETRVKGTGGLIAVDAKGRTGVYCSSEYMSWAQIGSRSQQSQAGNVAVLRYGCDTSKVFEEIV